jgi:hypothetical protein
MPIDYEKLLALKIPEAEHSYTERDTIFYALGVGLGHDPMSAGELAYVYEPDLKSFSASLVLSNGYGAP